MNYQTKSIFVVLGILFLIHGMRLISVEPLPEYGGLGETSFYLPRLSPITSFFTGALLFITILVPRKLFQKLGLSFVVARSFIGLITGILFLITQLLQYGSENWNLAHLYLYFWPWALFTASIFIATAHLRKTTSSKSNASLWILITTIALFLIFFLFLMIIFLSIH